MPDRVGQQLGNYRLTRLLGRGGFAEVYLGEHIYLGTEAAIKVLAARLTNEEIEQFRNEARTIARLRHPNIVRILDFGVDSDIPFLVMDYAPGGTLRQRYPKGSRVATSNILLHIKQIAAALQHAHDQKLIHRDVKPENILLESDNSVLLSDFGIVAIAHSSRSMDTQDRVGTLPYMAPEQLQGKPRIASDQYSLGVIVYEWLTGTKPFTGTSWEIVSQHLSAPPPPLREKVPTLSPRIEEVVMRSLAKDPHWRFASVQDFAQALVIALEPAQQKANVPTAPPRSLIADIPPTITATPLQNTPPILQKTKEQWIDEGTAHYDAGQYKEAIPAYGHAIALDPKIAEAYFDRGNAYYDLKEYGHAIADYDRAISLDPKYTEAYYNRGNAYSDLRRYQQAIADYDRAIALDPKYTEAYSNRGEAYAELKEYEQAIADYNRAITLNPNDADAYNNRGEAYFELKQLFLAIADYSHALQLNTKYAQAYFNRGEAYAELKEYEQAITDYNRAIALDPNYVLAYSGRGLEYYSLGDYQRAIHDFDHALQLNPGINWVNNIRDEAYQRLKRQR